MDPSNWTKFQSNLPANLRSALKLARTLPSLNVGIFLQDKSSRVCFADLEKTNSKVDKVLSDNTKYLKLGLQDPAHNYQKKIKTWYSKSKASLKSLSPDLSFWISPTQVTTPHLRSLIKTHKPECPVYHAGHHLPQALPLLLLPQKTY